MLTRPYYGIFSVNNLYNKSYSDQDNACSYRRDN